MEENITGSGRGALAQRLLRCLFIPLRYAARVKIYAWNEEKNQQLKTEQGISFEEVLVHIAAGDLLDIVEHPHPEKYKGQRIFIVKIRDYAWLVPFVET
ncbi:MAG: hypothetical protein ACK4WK_01145 [Anaerolineae bacterium]